MNLEKRRNNRKWTGTVTRRKVLRAIFWVLWWLLVLVPPLSVFWLPPVDPPLP
jgi:hypothetical protein